MAGVHLAKKELPNWQNWGGGKIGILTASVLNPMVSAASLMPFMLTPARSI
jgi:hypothetical protein